MKKANNNLLFVTGILLLAVPGLLHAYLLMPFPGSQDLNAITTAYYLEKAVNPLRLLGAVFIIWYLVKYWDNNSIAGKITKVVLVLTCLISFYFTDVLYKAETMFEEPQSIKFANAFANKVPESYIVIGVVNNGVAKAYPLIYLGYHHKVQDSVGNKAVLVTYCTMCRTGRVYSPLINGKKQGFRLVGARYYNAIIEDEGTKTWWYQATGAAAVGKLKGQHLQELPYEQATLTYWLSKHPESLILQPDKHYLADYASLKNYDRLQPVNKDKAIKNKDSLIRKSWVLGVIVKGQPKAYNWHQLQKTHIINDTINNVPILLTIGNDSLTFHAFDSHLKDKTLHFRLNSAGNLIDEETGSLWNEDGLAVSGQLKDSRLNKLQAYQEYWHSWKHFHPNTLLKIN